MAAASPACRPPFGAADELGLRVGVLTKAELAQAATRWAQGGVAAALGGDPDSTDLHLADTLAAGAGLCDVDAVRVLVDEGPARVSELIAMGAVFDRDREGRLLLAREGGHSLPACRPRRRRRHGRRDRAGPGRPGPRDGRRGAGSGGSPLELVVRDGRCTRRDGALDPDGGQHTRCGPATCCWPPAARASSSPATTNPLQSTGDGLAMALRAGVAVRRRRVRAVPSHRAVQPADAPAAAVRGAARPRRAIRDSDGERFVDELRPATSWLAPSRPSSSSRTPTTSGSTPRGLERFDERFPTIAAELRAAGLDPAHDLLPIAPAAHYQCGGVAHRSRRRHRPPGLWAAGEVACTGVHGANRLASNSLLEGMVFGPRVVEAIERGVDGPAPTGAMRAMLDDGGPRIARTPLPAAASSDLEPKVARPLLQREMTRGAGVLRSAASLEATRHELASAWIDDASTDAAELRNLVTVASALLDAALAREESRGCHTREDFPDPRDVFRHRLVL